MKRQTTPVISINTANSYYLNWAWDENLKIKRNHKIHTWIEKNQIKQEREREKKYKTRKIIKWNISKNECERNVCMDVIIYSLWKEIILSKTLSLMNDNSPNTTEPEGISFQSTNSQFSRENNYKPHWKWDEMHSQSE